MKQYISIENERKIDELLNDENSEIIVKQIINKYSATSLEHAQDLLTYINEIVKNIISLTGSQIQQLNQASWMLLFQTQMDEKDKHSYFATMVPVMKTLFPDGYPENGNLAQKEYFNKFIALCTDKKAFDWDNKSDVSWAKQYDYFEYLDMIFTKYIDRGNPIK